MVRYLTQSQTQKHSKIRYSLFCCLLFVGENTLVDQSCIGPLTPQLVCHTKTPQMHYLSSFMIFDVLYFLVNASLTNMCNFTNARSVMVFNLDLASIKLTISRNILSKKTIISSTNYLSYFTLLLLKNNYFRVFLNPATVQITQIYLQPRTSECHE